MFVVGQRILFAKPSIVELRLLDEDWDVDDFWWDYGHYEVSAVNNDGSLYAFQDLVYYGEDEDGNEYELDEPEGDGHNVIYERGDSYFPYTKAMLQAIKDQPVNKLDSVCKKVVYLYRKHNDNPNTNFKWRLA